MAAFSFNGEGLKKFVAELNKLPALYDKAIAATLNDQAFKFKEEAAAAIIGEFTSRRPDFVKREIRVKKATASSMEAIAGSVGIENNPAFSGFVEMLGAQDTRIRTPTLAGRGGQAAKILPQQNRLMPGANFPDTREMDENLPIAARLSILHRRGQTRFLLGGPEFPAGFYAFEKGKQDKAGRPKVQMLQSLRKPKAPRRFDWIQKALAAITPDWISERLNKNLDFEFKKFMGKKFQ
jgi:hypothetical protein